MQPCAAAQLRLHGPNAARTYSVSDFEPPDADAMDEAASNFHIPNPPQISPHAREAKSRPGSGNEMRGKKGAAADRQPRNSDGAPSCLCGCDAWPRRKQSDAIHLLSTMRTRRRFRDRQSRNTLAGRARSERSGDSPRLDWIQLATREICSYRRTEICLA